MKKKVCVGMSGGVDSSVSALLLKEQGYDVIGLFMKNWENEDPSSPCMATQDYEDVVRVCHTIDIPYYTFNFSKDYRQSVFDQFLKELQQGFTPNPDILCNREIKFKVLLQKALELGAEYLATGHYAQTQNQQLYKAQDLQKDQTYFLYTLNKDILQNVLFPIGHLKKSQVRQIASHHHLSTATKKDSTGICFIGEKNFSQFLSNYIPYQKGEIRTLNNEVIGSHLGIAFYTIGQRKGLQIGGLANGTGKPWFVIKKDPASNILYVDQGENPSTLYHRCLIAREISWIQGVEPEFPLKCQAKIRYRQIEQECIVKSIDTESVLVEFLEPQRAITPRQAIVFYQGPLCLGGALIEQSLEKEGNYE